MLRLRTTSSLDLTLTNLRQDLWSRMEEVRDPLLATISWTPTRDKRVSTKSKKSLVGLTKIAGVTLMTSALLGTLNLPIKKKKETRIVTSLLREVEVVGRTFRRILEDLRMTLSQTSVTSPQISARISSSSQASTKVLIMNSEVNQKSLPEAEAWEEQDEVKLQKSKIETSTRWILKRDKESIQTLRVILSTLLLKKVST